MSTISPKVWASTIGAAAVTILVWGASLAGVDVPVEVSGAVTILIVAALGYFVSDPRRS